MSDHERFVFLLQPGDLLLNWRSSSSAHVGKTAIFRSVGEFTFASFLLRIRTDPQQVTPEFLKLGFQFHAV
jgi:hypothetical protein